MYEYNADVAHWIDADTVVVDVDLGFHVWHNAQHLRLAGISCRERSMLGGREAKQFVEQLLSPGTRVRIRSSKLDHDPADTMSFDRYVTVVQLADGRDLADLLVAAGYACRWDGKSKPTPYPDWPIAASRS